MDYYNKRADDQLSYLSDMWALHITNTGFRWNKVSVKHTRRLCVRFFAYIQCGRRFVSVSPVVASLLVPEETPIDVIAGEDQGSH